MGRGMCTAIALLGAVQAACAGTVVRESPDGSGTPADSAGPANATSNTSAGAGGATNSAVTSTAGPTSSASGEINGAGGGMCGVGVVNAGEIGGAYFYSLSLKIRPLKPIVFLANLSTTPMPSAPAGYGIAMSIQPLEADDRTLSGTVSESGPYPVAADGSFTAMLPDEEVPEESDPIAPLLLQAQITLVGDLCEPSSFICGEVAGTVTKPITIPDLSGSTFTMQKIADPTNYPAPLLDCARTPAGP
jgi:hypothetical protein